MWGHAALGRGVDLEIAGPTPSDFSSSPPALLRPRGVVAVFTACAAAVVTITALSARYLPLFPELSVITPVHLRWQQAWANWDGAWYLAIAQHGYAYHRSGQSSTAFFPAYPLALRITSAVLGDALAAGVGVTLASALTAMLAFAQWLRNRVSPATAMAALLLLALYPYALYLYGTLYADATFLAATIGAFVLLERGHPVWAGLAGALAAASRPVGIVVVVALVLRAVELRPERQRGATQEPSGPWWRRDRTSGLGVLVSVVGLGGYASFLWWRFGSPLAFVFAERAWNQAPGPATWLKLRMLGELSQADSWGRLLVHLAHPAIGLLAIALVPRVVRRFGWAYGMYVLLVIGLPAVSTKDFFGMGRYALAAFPCFALAGEVLARQRLWILGTVLGVNAVLLVLLASLFARGYYLS